MGGGQWADMGRVAQPTRGLGITDTIGHQEAGCEYRVGTTKGKTCLEGERPAKESVTEDYR